MCSSLLGPCNDIWNFGSDVYINNERKRDIYEGGGVDYFISSHLFEAEGYSAQRKYSERLILMTGMVSSFPLPPSPLQPSDYVTSSPVHLQVNPDRALLKRLFMVFVSRVTRILPEDFTLYSIPQTLYKVHPDFDELLRLILSEMPRHT